MGALPALTLPMATAGGPELLSSRWTSFYRYAFLPFWVLVGLVLWPVAGPWLWALAVLWLAGLVFALWLTTSLRTVSLDRDALIVVSRGESHRIPLRDAEEVSGTVLLNPELAWIRFRRPTAFGTRVVFLPRRRSFSLSRHPVVARLNRRIAEHQAPGLPAAIGTAQRRDGDATRTIAIVTIAFVGVAVGVILAVLSLLRSVGPQDEALALARENPELVAALGEPIEAGWLPTGKVRVQNETGSADLTVPISGPRGEAALHLRARYDAGEWSFEQLTATLEGGRRIDLLRPAQPAGELI